MLVADTSNSRFAWSSATSSVDRCEVIEDEDGDRAWRLIREHRPTAALLDFQMPARA